VIFVSRSNNCGPWKIVTASNVKSKRRRSHLFVKSDREVVQFAAGSVQGSLLLKSGRFDPSLKLSLSLFGALLKVAGTRILPFVFPPIPYTSPPPKSANPKKQKQKRCCKCWGFSQF
jgi:hypothetical protein